MENKPTQFTRRDFIKLAGAAAAGTALAACGIKSPARSYSKSNPAQLVYQDWRTDWFPGLAQDMLAKFNEQHPDIHAYYTPDPENLADQMVTDMKAGTAADVFSGCCDFFPAWAEAGYLLDLRPYVKADIDKATIADWSEAQYNSMFTKSGVQFGLPKYHGALALFYNKDLFDAAGVEHPTYNWTHDDYLDAMKKLTVRSSKETIQWGSMFDIAWERIQMHVNGWGGHFVNPDDPTKCEMAAQPAQEAMEWLRARIWDDGVMPNFLDVNNKDTRTVFIEQRIAMVEDGSWALKDILDKAPFRVGVAPFPAGPQRKATLATTDGFCIYAGTKYPDAAWELLKFLISTDYGKAMARVHFLQPARASLVNEWASYIKLLYPYQASEIDLAAFADGQVKGYSVVAESFPKMAGVSDIAKAAWDKIYTLGKAPVSIMSDVCQQIESIQGSRGMLPVDCGCKTEA